MTCFAQNSFDVLQLENDYNNSQSIIYSIAQDSVGNLWMATEEGVLKNNSSNYQKYNTYNGLVNFSVEITFFNDKIVLLFSFSKNS